MTEVPFRVTVVELSMSTFFPTPSENDHLNCVVRLAEQVLAALRCLLTQ